MRKLLTTFLFLLFASATSVSVAKASSTTDLTAPIRQFLDGFNQGDMKKANAAYAAGDINIIDELAPHRWSGPEAGSQWAADYARFLAANEITNTRIPYGAPTRADISGDVAYVVVPCVYFYKDHLKALAEEAQMTFVLHQENGAWKIRAWTWTASKPHAAK